MPFLSKQCTQHTVKNKDNEPFWECFFLTQMKMLQLFFSSDSHMKLTNGEDFKVSMQSMDCKAKETFKFTLKFNLVFNMINNILH